MKLAMTRHLATAELYMASGGNLNALWNLALCKSKR